VVGRENKIDSCVWGKAEKVNFFARNESHSIPSVDKIGFED
jgi:hypothetical protein